MHLADRFESILLVGREPIFLGALQQALADERPESIPVVGVEAAIGRATAMQPEIIIFVYSGVEEWMVARELRRASPAAKLIVMADEVGDVVGRTLRTGADAWITKQIDPSDLPALIRQIRSGAIAVPRGEPPLPPEVANLTTREREILADLAAGLSNKQIARAHHVTEQTVKFHLTNLYRKLGVSKRTAAARFAHECGFVAPSDAEASEVPRRKLSS